MLDIKAAKSTNFDSTSLSKRFSDCVQNYGHRLLGIELSKGWESACKLIDEL